MNAQQIADRIVNKSGSYQEVMGYAEGMISPLIKRAEAAEVRAAQAETERDEAQHVIATLQGELNKALARIAQLESDINSLFEPDEPPSEPYSEMDLLQREAAGLP